MTYKVVLRNTDEGNTAGCTELAGCWSHKVEEPLDILDGPDRR